MTPLFLDVGETKKGKCKTGYLSGRVMCWPALVG